MWRRRFFAGLQRRAHPGTRHLFATCWQGEADTTLPHPKRIWRPMCAHVCAVLESVKDSPSLEHFLGVEGSETLKGNGMRMLRTPGSLAGFVHVLESQVAM